MNKQLNLGPASQNQLRIIPGKLSTAIRAALYRQYGWLSKEY